MIEIMAKMNTKLLRIFFPEFFLRIFSQNISQNFFSEFFLRIFFPEFFLRIFPRIFSQIFFSDFFSHYSLVVVAYIFRFENAPPFV